MGDNIITYIFPANIYLYLNELLELLHISKDHIDKNAISNTADSFSL